MCHLEFWGTFNKGGVQLVLPLLLQHHLCKVNVKKKLDTIDTSTLSQILEPMMIKGLPHNSKININNIYVSI